MPGQFDPRILLFSLPTSLLAALVPAFSISRQYYSNSPLNHLTAFMKHRPPTQATTSDVVEP